MLVGRLKKSILYHSLVVYFLKFPFLLHGEDLRNSIVSGYLFEIDCYVYVPCLSNLKNCFRLKFHGRYCYQRSFKVLSEMEGGHGTSNLAAICSLRLQTNSLDLSNKFLDVSINLLGSSNRIHIVQTARVPWWLRTIMLPFYSKLSLAINTPFLRGQGLTESIWFNFYTFRF